MYLHADGTVSVGISGISDSNIEAARRLQEALGDRFKVSAEQLGGIDKKPGGNYGGVCAEPSASIVAGQNSSPIIEMETIWRGQGNTNSLLPSDHPDFDGSGKYDQMIPCPTCAHPDNIYAYMSEAGYKGTWRWEFTTIITNKGD